MKISRLYFAAEAAARRCLPPQSEVLVARHDEVNDVACRIILSIKEGEGQRDSAAYREAMAASEKARRDLEADPLAAVVMDLRRKGNEAAQEEWRRDQLVIAEGGPQS